jgi:hypothetical protein
MRDLGIRRAEVLSHFLLMSCHSIYEQQLTFTQSVQ